MNLFRISRRGDVPGGEYLGAIVAAASEAEARNTHPCAAYDATLIGWPHRACLGWVAPGDVSVDPIGPAFEGTAPGVVAAFLAQ